MDTILYYHSWGEGQEEEDSLRDTLRGPASVGGIISSGEIKFKLWAEMQSGSWGKEEGRRGRNIHTFNICLLSTYYVPGSSTPGHPGRINTVLLEFEMCEA